MDQNIEAACAALDEFAGQVDASFSERETPLNQLINWMAPALDADELSEPPLRLSRRLRVAHPYFDSDSNDSNEIRQAVLINSIPSRLALMLPHLTNLTNSNIGQAGWAYFATFDQWERILFPGEVWAEPDEDTLPGRLRRQLRVTKTSLDAIVVDRNAVAEQLAAIKEGADLIGDLPVDAEMISRARTDVAASQRSSVEAAGQSRTAAADAIAALERLTEVEEAAKKILLGIEDVYRATTSHALAEAFNTRATVLRVSVRWWVALLIGALGVGATLGYFRVQAISEITKDPNVQHSMALIWVQVALGTLSLAAPLWMAWLATRQISQRFRLAEDYSFKASLATAYEGYRREAARIDEQFEKDLFGSALRHLDQEPLRFMADADHSSPYAELLSSPILKDALNKVPGLAGDLRAFATNALEKAGRPSKFPPTKPPRPHRPSDGSEQES